MIEVPLWDRRFIGDENYEPNCCDYEHGQWMNIYLIPDEIYDEIKDNLNIHELRLDEIYTLKYDKVTSFQMISNFHLIYLNDSIQEINDIKFSTDLYHRVGIVQYMWWWPKPYISFIMIPEYVYWNDEGDFPLMISMIFSHYKDNSFHPFFYNSDEMDEKFDFQLREFVRDYFAPVPDDYLEKRMDVVKWSLNEELKRLHDLELYKSLILTIENV